ncbi:hypothetical protein F4680DRAFT_208867 [Xylaria scruposa]|nr:hypothetical protein F4680DRAFT_208867 [Xylaria scruposa]
MTLRGKHTSFLHFTSTFEMSHTTNGSGYVACLSFCCVFFVVLAIIRPMKLGTLVLEHHWGVSYILILIHTYTFTLIDYTRGGCISVDRWLGIVVIL